MLSLGLKPTERSDVKHLQLMNGNKIKISQQECENLKEWLFIFGDEKILNTTAKKISKNDKNLLNRERIDRLSKTILNYCIPNPKNQTVFMAELANYFRDEDYCIFARNLFSDIEDCIYDIREKTIDFYPNWNKIWEEIPNPGNQRWCGEDLFP